MPLNVERAIQEGYPLSEIADVLARESRFNAARARQEGYSDDEIIDTLLQRRGQKQEPQTGFMPGIRAGTEELKGAFGAIGAQLGVEGAEQYAAEKRQKAAEIYRQPEFTEAPVSYLTGLLGQSIPFMAGPIAAGVAGAAAVPAGATALTASLAAGLSAGLASATQFTGTNLQRQLEEGKTAKDLELAKAVGAAIPQAALDTLSMRMIPGLGKIFGRAGIEMTEAELNQVARHGIVSSVADKVKAYGPQVLKTAGAEGLTEAAQQVLERAQAGLSITDEEAKKEYFDSFIGGALLGGTLSVPGTYFERGAARERAEAVRDARIAEERRVEDEKAAAEEAKRLASPEYLLGLEPKLGELTAQMKEKQAARGKKPGRGAEPEELEAWQTATGEIKELDQQIRDLKREIKQRGTDIQAAKEEAERQGLTPEQYFLKKMGEEPPAAEAPVVEEEAPPSMVELAERKEPEAKEAAAANRRQRELDKQLEGLRYWGDINTPEAVARQLAKDPAMAQAYINGEVEIKELSKKDARLVKSALPLQMKALEEARAARTEKVVAKEKEALERIGKNIKTAEDVRNQIETERYALRNIAQDPSNPVEFNEKLNKLIKLLEEKTKPAVETEAGYGAGALKGRRTAGAVERAAREPLLKFNEETGEYEEVKREGDAFNLTREADTELIRLLEKFRLMQQQKGAARDSAEMADLLEEIRLAAEPKRTEVLKDYVGTVPDILQTGFMEKPFTKSSYMAEIDRVRDVQEKAFPAALEAIRQATYFRNKPETPPIRGTITAKPKSPQERIDEERARLDAEERKARGAFTTAVLQEIEANRRADAGPSLTKDEANTIAKQLNNLLDTAARGQGKGQTVGEEIKKLNIQLNQLYKGAGPFTGITRSERDSLWGKIKRRIAELEQRDANEVLYPAVDKVDVIKEDVSKLVQQYSEFEKKGVPVKGAEKSFKLYRQGEEAPEPEGLDARRKAVVSKLETQLAETAIAGGRTRPGISLPPTTRATVDEALRFVDEGRGSEQLVSYLEEQAARFARDDRALVPELRDQLRLDKRVVEEGEQGQLFATGQQERADVRALEKRRDFLQKRIDSRKGKKLTLEQVKEQITDVREMQQVAKDLRTAEATAIKTGRPESPFATPAELATTRSTAANFQRFLQSAEAERLRDKKEIEQITQQERKQDSNLAATLRFANVRVKSVTKQLNDAVALVQAATRTAREIGKDSVEYKQLQAKINDALKGFDRTQLEKVHAELKKQQNLRDATYKAFTTLYAKLDAQRTKLIQEKENALDAVAAQAKAGKPYFLANVQEQIKRKYNKELRKINNNIDELLGLFTLDRLNNEGRVNYLAAKLDGLLDFTAALETKTAVEQQRATTYLRDFVRDSELAKGFLSEAIKLRNTLTKLQQSRAKIVTAIANEKRAATAIEAGKGKSAVERMKESQAEAARQLGMGLPGVRVERTALNEQLQETQEVLTAAKETLAEMETERQAMNKDPLVTKQDKAGLSKRITRQEKAVAEIEANIKNLQKQIRTAKEAIVKGKEKPRKNVVAETIDAQEEAAQKFLEENPALAKEITAVRSEIERKEPVLYFNEKTGEYYSKESKGKIRREVVSVKSKVPVTPQIIGTPTRETKEGPPPSKVRTILDKRKIAQYERTLAAPAEEARKAALRAQGRPADVVAKLVKLIDEKENEAPDTDAALSIGEENTTQVDPAQAKALAEKIKAGLPKDVKVLYVDKFDNIEDFAKVPGKLISAMGRMGLMSRDDDGVVRAKRVKGAVLGDGTVVVFGSHHATLAELEGTFAHELHGHYGVDMLLGEQGFRKLIKAVEKEYGGIMELAKKFGIENEVMEAADYYAKLHSDMKRAGAPKAKLELAYDKGQIQAMRELIAHIEEARVDQNLLQKAGTFIKEMIGALRAGLRKLGFNNMAEASTSDLYYMLRKSRKSFNQREMGAYVSPTKEIAFSRKPAYSAQVDPSMVKAVSAIVKGPTSIADRIKSEVTGIAARTAFVDRLAPMERVAEGLKKSAQAMQMLYYGRMYDQRMAWTGATVNGGAPKLEQDEKGNRVILSRGGANLKDIADKLSKVKGYGNAEAVRDLFTAYLASYRAENKGINKLNFSGAVNAAELKRIQKLGDSIPQFVEARKLYNEYNNGLINWLAESGAINKELAAELLKDQDYVPFYRAIGDNVVMEIAGTQTITIGNLQNQPYLKDLIGGDQKIQDFFTSSLQNTAMIVDMGLRNLATKEAAFSLQEAGLLKALGKYKGKDTFIGDGHGPAQPNTLRFKMDGRDKFVVVESEEAGIPSELLVHGLHGVTTTIGGFTKVLAVPARFLRAMVTRNPVYSARQIVRDSMTNYLLTGGNMTPVASAAKEVMAMYAGKSKGEKVLQERGVIGGQLLTGTTEDMQKIMLQLAKGESGWEAALAKLDRMHMKADASARVTLYNDFRKQGLSDMEATLATLESMNFSKRGTSGSLYALNMMVPFLNAQIQGLNVLYQAFTGKLPYAEKLKVQRKLITRGLMMAAGTLAYAAMMQDDEAYKNANLRDRLQNWFIRIPGVDEPIKVPIPFEAGLIFKALPEAVFLSMSKDEDATRVLAALGGMVAMSSPVGVATAVPQAVKPVVEAVANYQFYNGAAIESEREQTLLPTERVRDNTSGVARLLSGAIGAVTEAAGYPTKGISPIMIDHLINGYTAGLGLSIAQMIGTLVPKEAGGEPPTKRMSDMPIVGSMFQPVDATGQVTQFYEKAKEYEQIKTTFDKMLTEGREKEAREFADKYGRQIALADVAEDFKNTMSEFTQLERAVRASDMSPEKKREELDKIRRAKIMFSSSFNAASRQQ